MRVPHREVGLTGQDAYSRENREISGCPPGDHLPKSFPSTKNTTYKYLE